MSDVENRGALIEVALLAETAGDAFLWQQKAEMFAGYHAHGFDFAQVEGQFAWYHLFDQLGDDVIMQMDTGNCYNGGGDAIAALKKYPGRAKSLHLKEYGQEPGGDIGDGKTDWETVFSLCDEQGTEWYVVEEGEKGGTGFEVCTRSFEALKKMGKA